MIVAPPGLASDEQRAAVTAPAASSIYVGAGPGTGKTFLLVERYRFLRAAGIAAGQILVLTFSRRAAAELGARLVSAGFSRAEIDVRTFHGFAARVVGGGTAVFRSGRLLDGFSRRILLDAAVERTSTPALADAARGSRTFRGELESALADLGRAPHGIPPAVTAAGSPRLRDVLAIARAAAAARLEIGGNEIGELIGRAVADARRPGTPAARWLDGRYSHVLVDEFQDTDRVQLDLLAALDAAIFAVGDEAQSIYRFRGATNEIVDAAVERFGMQRFTLTLSRRCPPDVCELAARTPIAGLEPLRSAFSSGEPVEVIRLRAVDDEVAAIADAIEADLDGGLPAAQIAVLLRSFRPVGPLLIGELRRRSISVASIGREELLADARVGLLHAALRVLERPGDGERWERLLRSAPLRYDAVRIRFAREALASLRLDAALGGALADVCSDGVLNGTELAAALTFAAEAWNAGDIGTAARRLVRRLRLFAAVINDESPGSIRVAAARLKLVCDALAGAQRTAAGLRVAARCTDILARFEDSLPALALDDAGVAADLPGVRVLTVHAAKGLEFERVFIADAVAGRFPHDARPSTLLDDADRELLAGCGCDGPSVVPGAAELEEASLWYVAVTRAKRKLTISLSDQALNGDVQRPSRFIPLERRPPAVRRVDRESLAIRALRSEDPVLRREIAASTALDDAPALADYAREGPAAFSPLHGYPLQRKRALGVGDAELWLQCPRRLFYKEFAKLGEQKSPKLPLGTAIHDILRRFHAVRDRFGPETIDVAAWSSELLQLCRTTWNAAAYDSPTVSRAAQTAAEFALRSYARALAERANQTAFTVHAREISVAVPVGASALAGRIDRIDVLPDGSRAIVDYKLGHAGAIKMSMAKKLVEEWKAADADGERRKPLAMRASKEMRLQLALYASALTGAAQVAYVYLGGVDKLQQRNGAVYAVEAFGTELRAVVVAALAEIDSGLIAPLANGTLRTLPVTHLKETCTFCPYTGVCPGPAPSEA